MNLRDLEYLVAVVDHGTFAKAADACGVAQPTLSVQIKKLEAELDSALLERTTRSTSLTPVGHSVVQHAREILLSVDRIRQATNQESRILRIGVFPTLAQYLLPHIVSPLQQHLDEVDIHWTEKKSTKLLALIDSGELDAALLATPMPPHHDLMTHQVFSERFYLATPHDHRLAHTAGPLPLSCIADEELALLDDGHCLRDHVLSVCHDVGAGVNPRIRASSLETLRHMIAAGLGVSLIPELATLSPAPSVDSLVLKEFQHPAPVRHIVLAWPRNHPHTESLEDAASCVTEALSEVIDPMTS